MSHSPIEPDADPSRRAWLACPNCDHGADCPECRSSRNCDTHWQYLLRNAAKLVSLQCATCFYVWSVDTAEAGQQAPGEHDDAVIAKVWLGDCPGDIVTNPGGDRIYVLTADSVKVVNRFHRVVASIPIGAEPKQMMMSSDGSRIYVTGYDGALSIIDTGTMTAKTVLKQCSTASAVSPDGDRIYLAHGEPSGEGSGSWISAVRADGISVALMAVDPHTTGMALSPNGRRLYVTSAGPVFDGRGGTITVIDTDTHTTIDFVAIDQAPEAITVDAEGLLYVTHFHTNSISVVDPGTRCSITIALDDAPLQVVERPGTEFIYTANLHSVTAIDTSSGAAESLAVGELPRRPSIGADARWLYATDFAHGAVWVLDTLDNSVVASVPVCAHPAAVVLSPDGDFLYVTDSRDGTLTVVSTTLLRPH
jgi:DNA-binding beta-propeller fold protein YncE